VVVEDEVGKLFHDLPDEEGHARSKIAERVHCEVAWPVPAEELGDTGRCESPEVAFWVGRAHAAHRRCGGKEHAVRSKCGEAVLNALTGPAQQVERSGEDDAVVGVGRQRARHLEVRDERGAQVRGIDVDDGALGDAIASEPRCVRAVLNLENRPMDRAAACAQKGFDVPPIHRCASINAVVVTERLAR
jgi:hypothetical protein